MRTPTYLSLIGSFVLFFVGSYNVFCYTMEDFVSDHGQPLVSINLSKKGLTSLEGLEKIVDAEKVCSLNLSNNKIQYIPPGVFDRFIHLRCLDLSNNKIISLPPNVFKNTKELQTLNLCCNQLRNVHEGLFETLEKIYILNFTSNQFSYFPKKLFQDIPSLRFLYVTNNPICESDNEFIKKYKLGPDVIIEKDYLLK